MLGGSGLPGGSQHRRLPLQRAPEGSVCPVETEGSACPVGTTPKALATRSRQPKRVQATAVACATIEVAEHLPEGQSDPQVGSETSTGYGSSLYDD